MNILFLGGGRRVTLAEKFIEKGHKIFSYETSKNVPISYVAEIIEGRKWSDQEVVADIETIAWLKKIDLIIPLQDEAVLLLAEHQDEMPCHCLVGSYDSANVAFDKWFYSIFILDNFPEIYIPSFIPESKEFLGNIIEFNKKIIKPKKGFNSKGLHIITNSSDVWELNINDFEWSKYFVQDFIDGQEYTVDAYINREGKFIDAVPRIRIRVDGGEVVTSETIEYPQLVNYTRDIGLKLGIIGPYNTQFIIDKWNRIYTTETNARFGGGCTLSIAAGLDMVDFVCGDYLDGHYVYLMNSWKRNMLMERAYRDFYFEEKS